MGFRERSPSRRRDAARRRRRFLPGLDGRSNRLEDRKLLATVTVNTTADTFDYAAGVTVGGLGGTISLRDAVEAATNTGGATTIVLPTGTYNLSHATVFPTGTTAGGDSVTAGSDELVVGNIAGQNITIQGSGGAAANVVINQTLSGSRIFNADPVQVGNIAFNLANLTLQGATNVNELYGGGVILAGGPSTQTGSFDALALSGCVVQNNSTAGGRIGGAISYGGGGNLTVSDSTFTNNIVNGTTTNGGAGGAIAYDNGEPGTMTITNSTFTNNEIKGPGGGSQGGAVDFAGVSGTITGSTFTGNFTAADGSRGGAVEIEGGTSSTFALTGDTFTGNAAGAGVTGSESSGGGGALYLGVAGTTTVTACNFVNNSTGTVVVPSDPYTTGYSATGGAIVTGQGTITITKSRFHNNTASSGTAIANAGGTVSASDNWWGADAYPSAAGTDTTAIDSGAGVNPGGSITIASRLALALTASSTRIGAGSTSTLAASIVSTAAPTTPVAGTALDGLTLTFAPGTLGSVSPTAVAIANGTATSTFTAGSTAGTTSPSITLDNGTKTTSITVVGAPTATSQTVAVAFNTAKAITLTGSDPNTPALSLTYTVTASPAHGTLSGTAPNLTYTPAAGYHGTDSFTFTDSNGASTSNTATVTLNVAAGIPTANPQTVAVRHNTAIAVTLTATDPDVPVLTLTYTVVAGPTHGTLGGTAPNLTYTPTAGYHGADSFTFTTSNGTNTGAPATVTLNVGVGTPTATAQAVNTNQNTAVPITLTGTDDDTPALTQTFAFTQPSHGTVTVSGSAGSPTVVYTPAAGYFGSDSFAFTDSNGTNTSASATVSLTVNQVQATVGGSVGVGWGSSGTATLQTNADGLRLLPAGRTTDLPWLGINKLSITLSQAATLTAADVMVTGINVATYGPVTVSGSGTTYTITLAQPINAGDRVTINIGNAGIAAFTRRLDVLPGDFNDDGAVTMQDAIGIRNEYLGISSAVPTVFGDINGDGVVDVNDSNTTRRLIGTVLP